MSKTFSSGCGAGFSSADPAAPLPAGTDGLFPAGLEELLPAESDVPFPAEPALDGALTPFSHAGVFPTAGFSSPAEEPVSAFAAPPCWASVSSAVSESAAISEAVPGAASSFTSVAACVSLCSPPPAVFSCPPQPTSSAARQTDSKNTVAFFIRSPPIFVHPHFTATHFLCQKIEGKTIFSKNCVSI